MQVKRLTQSSWRILRQAHFHCGRDADNVVSTEKTHSKFPVSLSNYGAPIFLAHRTRDIRVVSLACPKVTLISASSSLSPLVLDPTCVPPLRLFLRPGSSTQNVFGGVSLQRCSFHGCPRIISVICFRAAFPAYFSTLPFHASPFSFRS